MNRMKIARKLAAGGMAASILLGILPVAGWADQTLKELDDPVSVELKTEVQAHTATVGQPFEAELNEAVHYQNWTIPGGTDFRGQISELGHSRRFSRAGYVVLQVQEASLPNGKIFSFADYKPRDKKLHHPEATTFGQTVLEQLPYTAVSTAVSVPLKYGADMDTWQVAPIALGTRMALGAGMALFDKENRGTPVATRIAKGAFRGTGIPRLVRFVRKDPEPSFIVGDEVDLYFNPEALAAFMQTADQASVMSEPVAPSISREAAPGLP